MYDILILEGSDNPNDNKEYIIKDAEKNSSGNYISVNIFGGPVDSDNLSMFAKVIKNNYEDYNKAGMLCSVRPSFNRTNTPFVLINDPNCATVFSKNFDAEKITQTTGSISIKLDDLDVYEVSGFDPAYTIQTLDSVIFTLNNYFVQNKLQIHAFKIIINNCYELAISNLIPNFSGDSKNRSISILSAPSNNGILEFGFSHVENVKFNAKVLIV